MDFAMLFSAKPDTNDKTSTPLHARHRPPPMPRHETMTIERCEIHLEALRFFANHGVYEEEREKGNHFTVDLRLTLTDGSQAIAHDQLSGTVNYAEVYDVVKEEMEQPSNLIEHVAGRILQHIFRRFPLVETATIKIRKDNPPMDAVTDGCSAVITARR